MEKMLIEIALSGFFGITIIFGGAYGIKYAPKKWETNNKFLVFATACALIYIAIEFFVQQDFKKSETVKYFVTYILCTVLYDWFFKQLLIKWGLKEKTTLP